jgi:1-acyl-sn-glycerol-3-phosphate acyltransferase
VNVDFEHRERLADQLAQFMAARIRGVEAAAEVTRRVQAVLEARSAREHGALRDGLIPLGEEHAVYPADPLARAISRAFSSVVLAPGAVSGAEHLHTAVAAGPTVILCNHQSYYDSTALDALLDATGASALADRIVSVAGPKVYTEPFRRFAALGLNTLPVPQSMRLEGTARLAARELAARVRLSLRAAEGALREGAILLVFAEGSRTRTGRLRPFLRAVHRYLELPGTRVVPAALVGTDRICALDADDVQPGPVSLTFGPPIDVASLTAPASTAALVAAHAQVEAMLPADYRPDGDSPRLA